MAQEKVPFTVRIAPSLKSWLEDKARWLPHEAGPGKREGQNLARFVEMILDAHKKGQKAETPMPPALPPQDQSALDAIRALRDKRRPLFDAIFLLAESASETEESARAVEALAALVDRVGSTRGRGGRGRKPKAQGGGE